MPANITAAHAGTATMTAVVVPAAVMVPVDLHRLLLDAYRSRVFGELVSIPPLVGGFSAVSIR